MAFTVTRRPYPPSLLSRVDALEGKKPASKPVEPQKPVPVKAKPAAKKKPTKRKAKKP
jgi:hypothetical protein